MGHGKYISNKGYMNDSPDKNNPFNIIPSGNITMQNVNHPVMGIDNYGNMQMMTPGGEYLFPGSQVLEIPMKGCGGSHYKQMGGAMIGLNEGDILNPFAAVMKSGGNWIQKATKSIERRGTEGVCTGDKFGGPTCRPGTKRYNLAKTFKKMAKKQFGGSMELQNYDTDKIVDQRTDTMKNYLSNNAMMALALEEAGQLGNQMEQFMQFGGNFGYNPNMYNRNNFAMAGMNQLPGAFGNFMGATQSAFAGANPYWKLKVKQQGGSTDEGWGDYFTSPGEAGYIYGDGSVDMGDGTITRPDGTVVSSTYGGNDPTADDPIANMEYLKNKYQNEGITDEFGNVYTAEDLVDPNGGSSSDISGGGNGTSGYSGGSGSNLNVTQEQPYTMPYQGPRTGNYVGNANPVNNQPAYVPGSQNQYGVFQGPGGYGGAGYGLFPMNLGKGRYNFAGMPDITYDPSQVYLKDYQYKGRFFGPGARKIKMTFSPLAGGASSGMPGGQPSYGSDMGQSYAGPNQNVDAYIEKKMDPTLYSKMLHGDASDEEIAQFNQQYKQLESDYYNDRSRQATNPITPETKTPFGTKVKNFFQEREVERGRKAKNRQDRRAKKRAPEYESAVHPDYNPVLGNMSQQYQYGGLAGGYPHRDLGVNFFMGIPMMQQGGPLANVSPETLNKFGQMQNAYQSIESEQKELDRGYGTHHYDVSNDKSTTWEQEKINRYGNDIREIYNSLSPEERTQLDYILQNANKNETMAYLQQVAAQKGYKGFVENNNRPTGSWGPSMGQAGAHQIKQYGGLAGAYPRRNLGMNISFPLPFMQAGGNMSMGYNNVYDNPNAVNGEDTTLIWKRKMGINPEEAVAWGISGLDMVSSLREAQDRSKNEEIFKQRMNADALFQPIDAGSASRGDYDPNSGMFRPHMQVPVQFTGANFGQIGSPASIYQEGGEYFLDDEQIELIKRMGGSIEYLD